MRELLSVTHHEQLCFQSSNCPIFFMIRFMKATFGTRRATQTSTRGCTM